MFSGDVVEVRDKIRVDALGKVLKNGKVESILVGRALDEANWLVAVIDLMQAIEKLPSCHFVLQGDTPEGVVDIKLSRVVRDYALNVIAIAPGFIKRYYPYHDLDPRVDLFYKFVTQNDELRYRARQGLHGMTEKEAVKTCILLNTFIVKIRSELVSDRFRQETRRCRRAARKNYSSAELYISKMFSRCSKLMVVRVDLGYPAEVDGDGMSGRSISVNETHRHRVRFFNNLKKSLIAKSLIGYFWKMEYGLKKGFHYHCKFFFDGSQVREDVTYGMLIGDIWGDVIGHKGMYWNCNAEKARYQHRGIGMVSHADAGLREGLSRAVNYLTKPNYYLYLSNHVFGRVFGKGLLPVKKTRGGRPRRNLSETNH